MRLVTELQTNPQRPSWFPSRTMGAFVRLREAVVLTRISKLPHYIAVEIELSPCVCLVSELPFSAFLHHRCKICVRGEFYP